MKRKSIINENDKSFTTRLRNAITSSSYNATHTGKYIRTVRNLPPLPKNLGMMCVKAGYTRYLNEIQKFLENKRFMGRRIYTGVYQYVEDTGIGTYINTPIQLINNTYKFTTSRKSPIKKITSNPTGIYYFMVFVVHNEIDLIGHAINILVDTDRTNPRIWVFDPHGGASTLDIPETYGKVTREKIVPNIKKMLGITNNVRTSYYTGPNLQARNNRGVCTTFYISFTEQIINLLNNYININQLEQILPNSTNRRIQFLNNPGEIRNVIERRSTLMNKKPGESRISKKNISFDISKRSPKGKGKSKGKSKSKKKLLK